MEPKVSIGLPVLNGERFLERAVDSVLKQDFGDWELLITDNGSTDRTPEIGRRYADSDPRIGYRRNPENLGATANFKIAFEMTRGEFFMWLAYDDWLAPTYLSSCLAELEADPDAVMCFTGMGVVDDTGEVFRSRTEPVDGVESRDAFTRFHRMIWTLVDPTAPVFGLMRRDALARTGLIRNAPEPDRILMGELALLGPIHQVKEELFLHYGPPGHTDRDNWAWLNPRNLRHLRLATPRITYHHLRAVWSSDLDPFRKTVATADLLACFAVRRTAGKARAMRRRRRR